MMHPTCDLVQNSQMNFYCWMWIELKFETPLDGLQAAQDEL